MRGDELSDQYEDNLEGSIRQFTGRLDYPLFVVTMRAGDGERSGCLAGFVTQCSMIPVRFIVCISKLNRSYFVAERSTTLALHRLGDDQVDLASLFGEHTGDSMDKFERCQWHDGRSGAPILAECGAWIEGSILNSFSVGDHHAFEIAPVDAGLGRHQGLLTFRKIPPLEPGHPEA
jgi:flavin reductase (DIM6/NTAB) family NADH-FMN oxidoreductase RutF